MKNILVLGGGFAGLWSAVGAARNVEELGARADVKITLVNKTSYHNIRVRNYEADLSDVCVPLRDVLDPIGVELVQGDVRDIDLVAKRVAVAIAEDERSLSYDRMVFALGSQVVKPSIPGLAENAFDIDTFEAAQRLNAHILQLAERPDSPGRATVVVVGAGLTGIEVATELPAKLAATFGSHAPERPRVILVDRNPLVGSNMGDDARPVIEEALRSGGVEFRGGVTVRRIDEGSITLDDLTLPASTVIWCAGMHANPLTARFPVEPDHFGRLAVDEFMRVRGVADVFAAGDVAAAWIDDDHSTVMSCQHGRPMGRYAGHNVVADALGAPMLALHFDRYTTILDLGSWGAVYTKGWDRKVFAQGATAKETKQRINRVRIYPPRSGDAKEILAAGAPIVQAAPEVTVPGSAPPENAANGAYVRAGSG
ncbi:MAG TPA: NAD(P)/FAD-dependent oxidoreductase [Candidatus Lustribacter sp.]